MAALAVAAIRPSSMGGAAVPPADRRNRAEADAGEAREGRGQRDGSDAEAASAGGASADVPSSAGHDVVASSSAIATRGGSSGMATTDDREQQPHEMQQQQHQQQQQGGRQQEPSTPRTNEGDGRKSSSPSSSSPVGLSLSSSTSHSHPPVPDMIPPPSITMAARSVSDDALTTTEAAATACASSSDAVGVDASLLPRPRQLAPSSSSSSSSSEQQQRQIEEISIANKRGGAATIEGATVTITGGSVPRLEARVSQLERSLEALTEFCQGLMVQQQQRRRGHSSEVAGYNSSPNSPSRDDHNCSEPKSPEDSVRYLRQSSGRSSSRRRLSRSSGGNQGLLRKGKTMSMVLLDIDPYENRGPNMIPFTTDLDACDEMDGDSVAGGCRDRAGGRSNSGSISGCGSKSPSIDGSSRSCGSAGKKEPSTTSLRSNMGADEGSNSSSDESSRRHQQHRPPRRLSSSMKETSPSHPEANLECQAYTIEHLKALRLKAGKGRAYSFNDSLNSLAPPKKYTHVLDLFDGSVKEPDSAGSSVSSFADVGTRAGGSGGGEDIAMPDLSMPDNSTASKKIEDLEVSAAESLPGRETKSVGTNTVVAEGKVLAHSTSCASDMSSDTSRTLKSGNTIDHQSMARTLHPGSVSSSGTPSIKESSQSISSSKPTSSNSAPERDSSTVGPTTATQSKTPPRRRGSIKGKSLHKHNSASEGATPKAGNKGKSPRKGSSHEDQQPPQTMKEYVINDLLNIDSRNQDGSATEDIDENMEEFLRVPPKLENLMFFSLAVAIDSFLYAWAMLPLKFVWGWVCLVCSLLSPKGGIRGVKFHRRHLYPIMQTILIYFVYSQVLCPISIGKLYHWIRGQAMLKLYVLIAIVEVFDRLLCSFGQDAWDSLYWNTTRRPRHPRMFVSIIVVGVYVTVHSLFLFVHVATLSVAVNSADNALLTLLISGNFAEIKSTVFKKYNKQNLFKITTSDICERFKLALFLLLILFLNRFQGEMTSSMVRDYYSMCGIVFAAELISDWIKHSFITKFNLIKSTTYFDYALVLSGDVTGIGHEGLNLDYTHAAVKRLGLAQIPLVCVTARYLHEAVRFAIAFHGNGDVDHPVAALIDLIADGNKWKFYTGLLQGMAALVLFKIALGMCIRYVARGYLGGASIRVFKSSTSRKGSTSATLKEGDSKKKQQ